MLKKKSKNSTEVSVQLLLFSKHAEDLEEVTFNRLYKKTPKSQASQMTGSHPCKAAATPHGIRGTMPAVWKQSGTISYHGISVGGRQEQK